MPPVHASIETVVPGLLRGGPARAIAAAMVVVALSAAAVVAATPESARAQQGEQQQLSDARARLVAVGEQLRAAQLQEQDADRDLEAADAALDEIERVLNEVAASVERQRASVRDAERRLGEVESDAARLQDAFADRIARLYMQGPELTIELLLSSGDADEAIARTVLLERLTEGDQVDLERLEAARIAVAVERERLAEEQRQLEDQLAEQVLVREEAETLRSSRALAVADAQARTKRLAGQEDDLEAEEERLEALVRAQLKEEQRRQRVEEERRETAAPTSPTSSSSGGAVSSGGYAWPMCAPVTSEYGPRWGRVHRGIDQGASSGTAIGAAKAGRVIFAGWQGGYGNLILVDHGGAVSAYAHQSRFAVGQGASVSRGQTIGYVGSTGNSTGPHLHLEIRVNGSAVNPRQYLSGSPC